MLLSIFDFYLLDIPFKMLKCYTGKKNQENIYQHHIDLCQIKSIRFKNREKGKFRTRIHLTSVIFTSMVKWLKENSFP